MEIKINYFFALKESLYCDKSLRYLKEINIIYYLLPVILLYINHNVKQFNHDNPIY